MRFRRLTIRKKSRPRALFEGQIDSQDTLSAKHNKNTVDGSEIRRENHPTCMKPVVNNWDIYHTNWCRMSSINSINAKPSKTKKTTNNHQPNNTCHNWNIYIYQTTRNQTTKNGFIFVLIMIKFFQTCQGGLGYTDGPKFWRKMVGKIPTIVSYWGFRVTFQ